MNFTERNILWHSWSTSATVPFKSSHQDANVNQPLFIDETVIVTLGFKEHVKIIHGKLHFVTKILGQSTSNR